MADRPRAAYRLIARLLPRDLREAAGAGLEDAAMACLARERVRRGRTGVAMAWVRLLGDAVRARFVAGSRSHRALLAETLETRGFREALMSNAIGDLRYALRALR